MKSAKVNQSKIGLKNDGAIQLEPIRIANIVKDFYSDSAGNLVRKLSAELNRFNDNSKKQYYLNIEKNCHNFKLCNEILETVKKKISLPGRIKSPCNILEIFDRRRRNLGITFTVTCCV